MRLLEDILKEIHLYKIILITLSIVVYAFVIVAQILDLTYFSSEIPGYSSKIITFSVKGLIHTIVVVLFCITLTRNKDKLSTIIAIM
jgi:hypothetical protein